MNFPIKAFVKMARASGFSREEAEEKLRDKAPEKDLTEALDSTYSKNVDGLRDEFFFAASEIAPVLKSGEGKNVDARGFDTADRAVLDVLTVMDED